MNRLFVRIDGAWVEVDTSAEMKRLTTKQPALPATTPRDLYVRRRAEAV